MTKKQTLPLLLILLCYSSCSGQLIKKREAKAIDQLLFKLSEQNQPHNYLIRDVHILTMVDSVLLTDYDVLITGGKIQEIAKEIIPGINVEVIDGSGKYLMPGLTDMHVHLFDHHQMKNTWMLLLLINGVTSVRDMAGEPGKLTLRDKIIRNELLAPNLYQAGPIINGKGNQFGLVIASTPEEGRKQVKEQKQLGYDFIKIYNDLSSEVYWAILDEAEKQDMLVTGHVPDAISLTEALNHQSSIEHLTGYKEWRDGLEAFLNTDPGYASITAQSNTWNCPTFYQSMLNWGEKKEAEELLFTVSDHIPKKLKNRWEKMLNKNVRKKEEAVSQYGEANQKLFSEIVINLYQANAKLIAGTDAGNLPLLVPGITLHHELKSLTKLGIAPYNVLKMTTVNAATAMNRENEFGTIQVGKRADLLLLNNNPLADIQNLNDKNGLMIRGVWLADDSLERISSQIQTIFKNK